MVEGAMQSNPSVADEVGGMLQASRFVLSSDAHSSKNRGRDNPDDDGYVDHIGRSADNMPSEKDGEEFICPNREIVDEIRFRRFIGKGLGGLDINCTNFNTTDDECTLQRYKYYSPDLSGSGRSTERGWTDCKDRCQRKRGCAYFTFWNDNGCHLAGIDAQLKKSSKARASGSAKCEVSYNAGYKFNLGNHQQQRRRQVRFFLNQKIGSKQGCDRQGGIVSIDAKYQKYYGLIDAKVYCRRGKTGNPPATGLKSGSKWESQSKTFVTINNKRDTNKLLRGRMECGAREAMVGMRTWSDKRRGLYNFELICRKMPIHSYTMCTQALQESVGSSGLWWTKDQQKIWEATVTDKTDKSWTRNVGGKFDMEGTAKIDAKGNLTPNGPGVGGEVGRKVGFMVDANSGFTKKEVEELRTNEKTVDSCRYGGSFREVSNFYTVKIYGDILGESPEQAILVAESADCQFSQSLMKHLVGCKPNLTREDLGMHGHSRFTHLDMTSLIKLHFKDPDAQPPRTTEDDDATESTTESPLAKKAGIKEEGRTDFEAGNRGSAEREEALARLG